MHSGNVNIFYVYTHRHSVCNKYSLSVSFAVCPIIDIIIDAAGFQKDTTGCVLNLGIRAHLSGPGIFSWVLDHCHPRVLLFSHIDVSAVTERKPKARICLRWKNSTEHCKVLLASRIAVDHFSDYATHYTF